MVGEEGNGGFLQGIAGMVSLETWGGTKLLDAMADGDPVYVLADLGGWVSGVTGSIMTAVFVADKLLTTGVLENVPVIGKKISGLKKITGYLALPMFIFFILGILLQYYLQAIPYIVWITGVCGWLLLLLESVVSAPLFALTHALPGHEEGMVTGRSGQGYMLICNILMRPPLMVAAFYLSFGVLAVVTPIVASTLKLFLFGLMGSNAENQLVPYVPSLPRMAMSIVLVAVVMGVVIHKVFQLVTVLPDRVIRWVGGHAESLDEAEAEQKTRTAVVGVTRQAGNVVGSGSMRRGGAIGAAAQRAPGAGQGAGDAAADLSQAMPGESGGHAIDGIIPTGGNDDDTLRGR